MSTTSLVRIPYRVEDERMIEDMARWMRFVAVVTLSCGLFMLFLVLFGGVLVTLLASPHLHHLGHGRAIVHAQGGVTAIAWAAALALACAGIYSGTVLYRAADDFDRMARTDGADQELLVFGVHWLARYFQVFVVASVLSVVVGLVLVVAYMALAAA